MLTDRALLDALRGADNWLNAKCRRRKCVAAAINDKGQTLVCARNGTDEWDCTNATDGECGCRHAEAEVCVTLLRSGYQAWRPYTLVTTLTPCDSCANLIAASKLFKVVRWRDDGDEGMGPTILRRAKVDVRRLEAERAP